MTSFNERVNRIIEDSDFNALPEAERKKIIKYTSEMQILTLWQVLNGHKNNTTETYRKQIKCWLANCVDTYYKEYIYKE